MLLAKFVERSRPASNAHSDALDAVSCTSAVFCMAVGVWQHAPGASLAEKWNGKSWELFGPVIQGAGS